MPVYKKSHLFTRNATRFLTLGAKQTNRETKTDWSRKKHREKSEQQARTAHNNKTQTSVERSLRSGSGGWLLNARLTKKAGEFRRPALFSFFFSPLYTDRIYKRASFFINIFFVLCTCSNRLLAAK